MNDRQTSPISDGAHAPLILVTGAARRVGAEIARSLHEAGARLALHYRNSADEAEALAAGFNATRGGSAFTVRGDLARFGAAEDIAAQVLARGEGLDGLVNNASSFFPTPVGHIDRAAWDELVGSNLMGPLFLSQALAPALCSARGAIVNIVDIHAERPLTGYTVYNVAKGGLATLTRSLAIDLAPEVRVNGVAPGPIDWPEDGQFQPEERERIIAHTLLKRVGSPADIARTVRFLMLDAPYITGQIIAVDGGRSVHL